MIKDMDDVWRIARLASDLFGPAALSPLILRRCNGDVELPYSKKFLVLKQCFHLKTFAIK